MKSGTVEGHEEQGGSPGYHAAGDMALLLNHEELTLEYGFSGHCFLNICPPQCLTHSETASDSVAQTGLELTGQLKLTSNLKQSSCLSVLCARITGSYLAGLFQNQMNTL